MRAASSAPSSRRSTIGRVAEFVPPDSTPRSVSRLRRSSSSRLGLSTTSWITTPGRRRWSTSRRRPGIPTAPGREMTREENRADMQRHADDFRTRKGFTYTVIEPVSRDVIGCVYIYPVSDRDYDACALSWVRESRAHLDAPLWRAVSEWLDSDWPFRSVKYASRAMLRGRCECKAVAYEVADEFVVAYNCHCSNCRATTGSAFLPWGEIEREKLRRSRDGISLRRGRRRRRRSTRCAATRAGRLSTGLRTRARGSGCPTGRSSTSRR